MFGLILTMGIGNAEIPEVAWEILEREMTQQSIRDAEVLENLFSEACRAKHKASCQWQKKSKKTSIDSWVSEQCLLTSDPWACVGYGWQLSQRSEAPGIPYRLAPDWDEALTVFENACRVEPRGCVELARLELGSPEIAVQTKAVERLKSACEQGNLEGCYSWATLLADGVAVDVNVPKATELLTTGCTEGHAKSCASQALLSMGTAQNAQGALAATRLYERGCELGSTEACVGVAQHYEQGIGVDMDFTKSLHFYGIACENYHAEACDKLGLMYSEGRGVDTDLETAAGLFTQSCAAENPFACYNMAALQEQRKLIPEALSLLSQSCAFGSGRGCFTYGLWLEQGKGTDINLDTALNAYGKGCDLEYSQSCVNGGILAYRAGRMAQAMSLYQNGCQLGGGIANGACASYAMMMETGEGGFQDLDLARDLYQKACMAGDTNACSRFYRLQGSIDDLIQRCNQGRNQACYDAAQRLETGRMVLQNQTQAFELVNQSCGDGHNLSCVKQAYYYLQGIGTDIDAAKALSLNKRACEAGEAKGCHSMGLMYAEGRGVEQNLSVAVKMLAQSCELKEGASCGAAAYLLRSQNPPDYESSLTYARKGCTIGNLDACAQEAFVYTQSPRINYSQAAKLFKDNCARNHAKSCFNYAAMLHQGQGVTQNPEEALRVMNHACVLGDEGACAVLSR